MLAERGPWLRAVARIERSEMRDRRPGFRFALSGLRRSASRSHYSRTAAPGSVARIERSEMRDRCPGFRGVYHWAGPTGPAFGRPDGRLRPDPVDQSGLRCCVPVLPRINWQFDRRAICSPRQHAILIGAQLRHGCGQPNAAINDEAQHREGEQVVYHAAAIIVVLARLLVFAQVADRRAPRLRPTQIVITGAWNARPKRNDSAFLLVPLWFLRIHLRFVAAQ